MSSRRSRSFDGCWTCRRRRVRCDGAKPGCNRCATAGFQCSGYGFRFDIPPGVQSSRQQLAAASRPDLYLRLTNGEIDQHLHDIDSCSDSMERGPFSVISFSSCATECRTETDERCWEYYRLSSNQLRHSYRDQCVTGPQRPIALVCLAAQERALFEHYVTFVADQLMPFADVGSEDYFNAGPSVALKGKVFEAHDMDVDATRSVFHSICAVGAHSLAKVTGQSSKYSYLALRHENMAIHHLQRCIVKQCTSYLAMATTIMYFCIGEQVAGRTRWPWEHTQAGIRCLLLSIPREGQMDCYTASICAQYVFMGLMRTDVHAPERQAILKALAESLGPDGQQKFVLDLRLVNLLYRSHETGVSVSPCHYPDVMGELYRELKAIEPPAYPDTRQNRIRRITHQATCVTFARHLRRARPKEVEPEVEKALNYLEELHDENNESQLTSVAYSTMMIYMQRLAPRHEERLLKWIRGRFAPGLGHINYSLDMMRDYWGRQGLTEHDPASMNDMLEAVTVSAKQE